MVSPGIGNGLSTVLTTARSAATVGVSVTVGVLVGVDVGVNVGVLVGVGVFVGVFVTVGVAVMTWNVVEPQLFDVSGSNTSEPTPPQGVTVTVEVLVGVADGVPAAGVVVIVGVRVG